MNIASRIEGIAHPGGIAVSEATKYGSEGTVLFAEGELVTLKGVGEVRVFRVILED